MNNKQTLSIGRFSASAAVLVFIMTGAATETFCDSGRYNPARTMRMIERHLQDGGTDLPSGQLSSVARTLYDKAIFYGIDYRLALAVMAVESNFRTDAVSPAGARGIMQIRPILASAIAGEAGIRYREASDLFEPAKNIRLGLHYLSWLSSVFKSTSEVLLAYNIGHNGAKRHLSRRGNADSRYTRRVMDEYRRNKTSLPAI